MDKQEHYTNTLKQLENLMDTSLPPYSNLSNFTALLKESMEHVNWVGFYLYEHQSLFLGPFQGKVACTMIPMGKGVCGKSAETRKIINVADVSKFIGHIACDSMSKSEIVLPIILHHNLYGVLDIDSDQYNNFDLIDQQFLESALSILITCI